MRITENHYTFCAAVGLGPAACPWPPTDARALFTVMATRPPLNALKLSWRTLKHIIGAAASWPSSSSAAENANTRLRIDEHVAGDCVLRNDDSDSDDDAEEENADDDHEEEEQEEGDAADEGADLADDHRLCRIILGSMALKMLM